MYTLQQQVFALSIISNADSTQTGQTPAQLEADLTAAIDMLYLGFGQYIGTWNTVWGPVAYEYNNSGAADNAMFVAQGSDAEGDPVYVVAIAGTDVSSQFDALTEDFDTTLAPWPYEIPSSLNLLPNVSQGTLDGLGNLVAMTYPIGSPPTSQTLAAFLSSVTSTTATVIFTGHSLGGALAPALALAMFGNPGDADGPGGGLDQADWKAVYVFPTAGPAVGDADYAEFYQNTFGPAEDAQGETWNLLVWNSLDVVPHAWSLLSQLNTLYPQLTWSGCLSDIQAGLETKGGSGYAQLQNSEITGTFVAPTVQLNPVSAFLAEAVYQHVWAYFDLLNVGELRAFLQMQNPLQNPPSPGMTTLCDLLILRYCLLDAHNQCGARRSVDLTNATIRDPANLQA